MATFLEKSTGSEGFHQVIDFLSQSHISYALTKKPEIYILFIKQFWRTAEASTDTDGENHDGTLSIPTQRFEQLALMGYQTDLDKLTFQKGVFSPQWRFLIHTLLHCLSPKKTAWEQFSSNIATALICLATNRKDNFSRLIFEHMVTNIGSPHKFLMYPRFIQICLDMQKKQLKTHSSTYLVPSLNNKVFSNMRRLTKGYTGVEIRLFPTMLTLPTHSSSPSRIISSPSLSSAPSTEPTFEPQPSPDAEYHIALVYRELSSIVDEYCDGVRNASRVRALDNICEQYLSFLITSQNKHTRFYLELYRKLYTRTLIEEYEYLIILVLSHIGRDIIASIPSELSDYTVTRVSISLQQHISSVYLHVQNITEISGHGAKSSLHGEEDNACACYLDGVVRGTDAHIGQRQCQNEVRSFRESSVRRDVKVGGEGEVDRSQRGLGVGMEGQD
ncbi:hypothetical protein Tco_0973996 [Tanacetum coccineum]|uniref:Uncharacterized protein n=1 Tax=Tanacetum coccineum TaxID=301880 RepID=A0ABQ5EAC6_9ASTR